MDPETPLSAGVQYSDDSASEEDANAEQLEIIVESPTTAPDPLDFLSEYKAETESTWTEIAWTKVVNGIKFVDHAVRPSPPFQSSSID